MLLEILSIELTNRCAKGCWFCYNHSHADGGTEWSVDELCAFLDDCSAHGVKAVSFGGGEPLQFAGIFDLLRRLRGRLFRSLTTNGLLLSDATLQRLAESAPDKVHISIHFPDRAGEVERVARQVQELSHRNIRSGVNLLVARSNLEAARRAAAALRKASIENDRIIYLPMRHQDTPTPAEVASVAGGQPFQSMSCLTQCGSSPRFCSISWDRTVAWCSYTTSRAPLASLSYAALQEALTGLGLTFCGGIDGT